MEYSEKQLQIIEAAEKLFATNGYEGTSVRDIAHEAGVNLAMISYYFGSKEKLLEALFDCRSSQVVIQLENTLQNNTMEPLQKIYLMIDSLVERVFTQQYFHKIMVREQMAQHIQKGPIADMIHQTKMRNQAMVRQLIHEGQKKGIFKKNIDISLMLVTLYGTANQLVTTQHYYREINNLQDMPDEEFKKYLKKKLSLHLKTLFKAILTYDA